MSNIKGPGWPDMRGWVAAGFFALEFFILWVVKEDGTLLQNASFMQMATTLTTGGVLLIAMNLFGGTKAGAETNAKVADALTAATSAAPVVQAAPVADDPPKPVKSATPAKKP